MEVRLDQNVADYVVLELVNKVQELERQKHWLAEQIHKKGTVSYGKYPPTTEGWIKAAEQAVKDFGI